MDITRRGAFAILLAALVAGGTTPSSSHDADAGPNGGPMVEVKGHHLELVTKDDDLVVVLSDAGHAPITSAGATGRAVILEGSAQRTVMLAPMAPDRLTAKLDKPLASGARIVVSAKLAGGQDLLARFVVK